MNNPENAIIQGARILIVDDEPDNLSLLRNLFDFLKADVTTAASGADALVMIEMQEFDILLLDIRMPKLSGEDMIRAIRANANEKKRTLPVIAVTSHALVTDRKKMMDLGFDFYLSKPVNVLEVARVVAQLLRERRAYG